MWCCPKAKTISGSGRFFEENSSSKTLAIEARSLGDEANRSQLSTELKQLLARLIAEHGVSPVHTAAPMAKELAQLKQLHELTPRLLPADHLEALRGDLDEAALRQRIEAIAAYLRRPDRSGNAWALLADPLGLSAEVLKPLTQLQQNDTGAHQQDGHFTWHADGQSLMLLVQIPFAPADNRQTAPLLNTLDAVAASAAQRGIAIDYVGSYRHFRDNNRSIHQTLITTIPLSLLLIGLALFSLFRSFSALAILHIPVAAAALGSAIALTLGSGLQVPLIVLGFGSCIVGIAIDYGIHMTHAALQGEARSVMRPIAISAASTGSAMLALLFSDIAIINNLGYLLVGGIAAACLGACDLLPRCVRPQPHQRLGWNGLSNGLEGWLAKASPKRLALSALLTLALAPGLWRLGFIADLQQMDGSSAETRASLRAFESRWGGHHNSDFLVSQGDSLDAALKGLRLGRSAAGLPPSPLSCCFPTTSSRKQTSRAWNRFWSTEAAAFRQRVENICADIGLRSSAFAEAFTAYRPVSAGATPEKHQRAAPPTVSAETWADSPFAALLTNSLDHNDGQWQVAILIPRPGDDELEGIEQAAQAHDLVFASRRLLAADIIAGARHEFFARGGMVIGTMLLVLVLCLRRLRLLAAVALPPCLTLIWTFGLLGLLGVPLMPSHVIVAAFVCGIGIDDALFLTLSPRRRQSLAPICATTMSTVIGVGSLMISDHPILVSTGQALVIGMACCLASCLLVAPTLVRGPETTAAANSTAD